MNFKKRIGAFSKLGEILRNYFDKNKSKNNSFLNKWETEIEKQIAEQHFFNAWFTPENVEFALKLWAKLLTRKNIEKWLSEYKINEQKKPKNIGVILAGNIPLVGMHDFVSVLISGNNFIGKLSSKDDSLLKLMTAILCDIEPDFSGNIIFTNNILQNFDAVIATGSNNSARYFEYYFAKYPSLIRKNRNSIAILNGKESDKDLENLSNDVFLYFGLGCRSVSKIYVPENYDFDKFFIAFDKWNFISKHNKYANNYDYYKSVYQMNKIGFLDNGFMLLKNDNQIYSPLAVIFYEYYSDIINLAPEINKNINEIQCIVSKLNEIENSMPFGTTQNPHLCDYADNADTMKFLLNL
ncbi:MAG: hypothetical protein A2X08_07500 [Bacteroidetes bacterium GWA2_32_17]|nr:MAG: hypothetical protein A2X08_07500 [Bacteroidetes bacterium GWA2_32_17]